MHCQECKNISLKNWGGDILHVLGEKNNQKKKLVNWEVNYLVKSLECCSISQLERMRLNWEFLHSVNKKQIYYRSCHFLGKNSFLKNFWCIINKIFHNLQILSWIMHPTTLYLVGYIIPKKLHLFVPNFGALWI